MPLLAITSFLGSSVHSVPSCRASKQLSFDSDLTWIGTEITLAERLSQSGSYPTGQGDAGVCWWKIWGSILIALLIELETKQFSLAFSRIRGMRARSSAE
jgi:hypothetical protein